MPQIIEDLIYTGIGIICENCNKKTDEMATEKLKTGNYPNLRKLNGT